MQPLGVSARKVSLRHCCFLTILVPFSRGIDRRWIYSDAVEKSKFIRVDQGP